MEIDGDPTECAQFVIALESMRKPEPPTKATGTQVKDERQKRTYGGKPNRRHMILNTLAELHKMGQFQPKLEEICHHFQELFPEQSTENLDQVVRDLANKTDLVNRCDWGTFELSGKGLSQTRE